MTEDKDWETMFVFEFEQTKDQKRARLVVRGFSPGAPEPDVFELTRLDYALLMGKEVIKSILRSLANRAMLRDALGAGFMVGVTEPGLEIKFPQTDALDRAMTPKKES